MAVKTIFICSQKKDCCCSSCFAKVIGNVHCCLVCFVLESVCFYNLVFEGVMARIACLVRLNGGSDILYWNS